MYAAHGETPSPHPGEISVVSMFCCYLRGGDINYFHLYEFATMLHMIFKKVEHMEKVFKAVINIAVE